MGSGVALYYPNIHLYDEAWLKAALLYWENGLRRIVPPDVTPMDGRAVKQVEAAGLLRSTLPKAIQDAGNEFWEAIDWDKIERISEVPPKTLSMLRVSTVPMARRSEIYGSVRSAKLSSAIAQRLISAGLAKDQGDELLMAQTTAAAYMTILASKAADILRAPLVTDSVSRRMVQQSLRILRNFDTTPAPDEMRVLLDAKVRFPNPAQLRFVPVEKVIAFNRRHRDDIARFRRALESELRNIGKIKDKDAYADACADMRHRIEDELNAYSHALRELRLDMIPSLLAVSVPAGIKEMLLPSLHSAAVSSGLVALGVAFSAVCVGNKAMFQRYEYRRSNPYSYLLTANRWARSAARNSRR